MDHHYLYFREMEQAAWRFLVEHLTETQRHDLEKLKRFTVCAPSGNTYIIDARTIYSSVYKLKKGSEDVYRRYCFVFDYENITTNYALPKGDALLAKKLHIEAGEQWFLRTAMCTGYAKQPFKEK